MKLEYAKKELVRRYKYLYENASYILAPYMYEQTEEEFRKMCVEHKNDYGEPLINKPLIYLNIDRLHPINELFEEFLLSDKPMESSLLYKKMESIRYNEDYIARVRRGLKLLEKDNQDKKEEMFKTNLGIGVILSKVYDYIEEQSVDLYNKNYKLNVIDEYFRILRYRNDGKIYNSGKKISLHDSGSLIIPLYKKIPSRKKNDRGVVKNPFITVITNAPRYEDNCSIFTEKEKQEIYLEYHDELPWNLEVACELNKDVIELQLCRPKDTFSCGETFVVKEEEIFVNPRTNSNDKSYRYYQLCPHCGYIVNIPSELLSNGIKQRIEDRCSMDDKLFRKMILYSELFALDKNSTKGQKRVLKKQ